MPRISLAELAEQSFGTSLEQLDDRRIYKLLVKLRTGALRRLPAQQWQEKALLHLC